jgi:hypothetical protein
MNIKENDDMPQIKPRILTRWEKKEKARLQALQAAKQAKMDKYRTRRDRVGTRPVGRSDDMFSVWRSEN